MTVGLNRSSVTFLAVLIGSFGCERSDLDNARSGRDASELTRIEYRVEEAHRLGNVAFLDSVYAESFRFKHYTGELELRSERLAGLAALGQSAHRRDLDSLDVEIHGRVALTTGRIRVLQDDEDAAWRDYTIRYARVYVHRDGRWQLLTHHSTGLSFGAPTGSPTAGLPHEDALQQPSRQ